MSVKPIMKDVLFLLQKAEPATQADKQVAMDLLDTLQAHKDGCVGMAANMIGVNKAIIAVNMGMLNVIMFNPRIVRKSGAFDTEEGFKVFSTEFGNVGIVICFDRHLPESIRACALKGADLVLIPAANCKDEPMEMFEWECFTESR